MNETNTVNNKNCSPNSIFWLDNISQDDKVDIRPWNLARKTKNNYFLTAFNQKVLKDIKKSFMDVHLDAKIFWISPASLWNSTTVITFAT